MKYRKSIISALALVCLPHSATATVLFLDDFTTTGQSDDVNSQYTGGRQSGTLGNLQYRQGNGAFGATITGTIANEASNGFKTQIGNAGGPGKLWVVGGSPATSFGSVSLEHNFIENAGVGGYTSISFTLDPGTGTAGTGTSWAALTVGAGDNSNFGASGTGARGQTVNTAAAHFGILFRDNGGFQAFDGSTALTTGTYDPTPTIGTTHDIELRVSGLVDGNAWDGSGDDLISVYADGSLFYSYTKVGGYSNNFLTLQGEGDAAGLSINQFDNLQIATIPEPGTPAMILGGLGLFLGFQRRRNREVN